MSSDKALTRREFDEVMRRAAELAAEEPSGADRGFSDGEVVRIGQEVGLPERHVRQALTEVRRATGLARSRSGRTGALRRLFGKGTVAAYRTIQRPRKELADELDNFMVAGQLLQAVRRKKDLLQYRPAVDWASRLARAASATSRQHHVAAARLVEARLEALEDDLTAVEIFVDPGIDGEFQGGAILGGGAVGVATGAGLAVFVATLGPLAVAVGAGLLVGTASGLLVAQVAGRAFSRRLGEVQSEVEGILDGLESGEGLEPPPAAWRRWVKRHFRGVARDIIGTDDL